MRAEYVRAKWTMAVQQTATAGRAATKLAAGESGPQHTNCSHRQAYMGASCGSPSHMLRTTLALPLSGCYRITP